MEITGTIVEIFEEVVVSDKFKKREFVLKLVDNGYEQEIKFQTIQDKTTILNFVKKDDAAGGSGLLHTHTRIHTHIHTHAHARIHTHILTHAHPHA